MKRKSKSYITKHVDWFFEKFKGEIPSVRAKSVNDLPAYNMLISINAQTFEDLALKDLALKKGHDKFYPQLRKKKRQGKQELGKRTKLSVLIYCHR